MGAGNRRARAVGEFVHRRFLWLLIGVYFLAASAPGVGVRAGDVGGTAHILGHDFRLTVRAALLGGLLFAAGLGVRRDHVQALFRRPGALAFGLAASVLVPVMLLLAAAPLLRAWHDPTEVRDLLVGLAVVAAMPVAGSSAGWSRAASGDCALSLGLVLLSTLLSPISTPLALAAAGAFSPGEAGPLLTQLAEAGDAGTFLTLWVVVPMVLGFLTRLAVGESRADAAAVLMKLMTAAILLGLCYVNASACLPGVAADPDWDFLGLVAVVVVLMCGTGFAAGFGVARVVAADPARRAALVFGIGMANNGAGLSLGAGVLAGCPMALLPVVVVNLVQHLAAGWANAQLGRDHVSELNTRGGEPGPPRR